jgi:hypothetical protein
MGFDKLINFFNKNLSNISDELFDIPQVVANHIYIDMNFLMYNCIYELEEEINKIIMIIYGVGFTDIDIINAKLKDIFSRYHWTNTNLLMDEILDGPDIKTIISNFKKIINDNIVEILGWYLFNSLKNNINTTHVIKFIKTINIFFDGIPTYSKILEQRRRRMKNYIDSKNRKKIFKQYFDNIVNSIITEDDITFDYFEWINNMYSFDKTLGPYSNILIDLSIFIDIKLNEEYKIHNIKIYINNSVNYGESDYKIFKHMIESKTDCDVAIHSCDSDFIFLIIWYQLTSTVKYTDINLMLINYSKNNSSKKLTRKLYCGKKIINCMIEKYGAINNIDEEVSLNVIFDFLSLLILFGNDIMPPSYEVGPELTIKQIFEAHYNLYSMSEFVINLNNICVVNFKNLAKWLLYLKNMNSFSMIILSRFYKLPHAIINSSIDKYKTLDEIITNVLQKHPIYKDHIDMLIQDRGFYIENNSYQTLYNYIVNKADNMTDDIFNRPFKIFYDKITNATESYIKITENNNINDYMKLFISLNQTFFHSFNLYTPFNTLYYGDNIAPSIDMIINFINMNDMTVFQNECYDIISTKFNQTNYFNPISHHFFITPYLLDSSHSLNNGFNIKNIESMLNVINKKIKGIWLTPNMNISDFNLKNIDPYIFINHSNAMIKFYQETLVDKFFIDNNRLLKFKE